MKSSHDAFEVESRKTRFEHSQSVPNDVWKIKAVGHAIIAISSSRGCRIISYSTLGPGPLDGVVRQRNCRP